MKWLKHNFTQFQLCLIFLIPVFYFIVASYFRNLLGNLSLRTCDPEYIYFMSGLTLSDGNLKLGHIDNPGTPLQVLVALVFKIIYFFRSVPTPYVEDVLLHPDMYLSITSLTIAALTAGLLFYAGYKVFKITKSIFYALIVQTAPFLPVIWYDLIGRVAPELMMPFPVVLLTVFLIYIVYKDDETTFKEVILFALISAFGLTIKLTFLPLWLIPLFVIQRWKQKAVFLLLSILFFFIIAFPVTLQFHIFWSWVKNLFLHSGQYGKGDTNIIDFTALRNNLNELYGYEKHFFYVFFSLIIFLGGYIVWFRKKVDKKMVLLATGVIFTIVIQLLMVGKHYAHRYFIPVLMLSPLMIFIIAELIKKMVNHKFTVWVINVGIILVLIWIIQFNKQWLPIKTEALGTDIENRLPTWHVAQTLEKDSYKIITSQNYGCPFIEYTLFYSQVWASQKKREEYQPILNKLYPDSYSYFTWSDEMKYWGEKFNAQKVINSGKPVYLYLERNDEDLYNKTIAKLIEENGSDFQVTRKLVYLNPKTNEIIYHLFFSKTNNKSDDISLIGKM